MFKDDMDLSQETIDKLLEAVGGASKGKSDRRSPSSQQRDKEAAFNDSIGSPFGGENKKGDGSDISPPMRPPPPPPPKVSASDLDSAIPPPYRALKAGGGKDMWTPMMERNTYDSRPVEPGLSRWEIETPYLTREKDSEASGGRPVVSSPNRATTARPSTAVTAKGISSELDTLFSRTFDNRYKEPISKKDEEEKSVHSKRSGDTLDPSDEEEHEGKFQPAQGTSEALSWLMRKRQEGDEPEAPQQQGAVTSSSRKRLRSESSDSSSEGSEDDKLDVESSAREEKAGGLSNTKTLLVQRKTSILKNMKMLMEQKTRLDAQKEELSRNHRGSDHVLQGILLENTVLNEEITKQIHNMCALVDEINKSLDDVDEVQGKSKSKKNKKKKTRKKHKKEKRHRQSYPSDDENKSSKHDKSSKNAKLEKEELVKEEGNIHQSMEAPASPVVAPRYWDIVKPLSAADSAVVTRSISPLYEPREEYKKEYHREFGRKEHEGRDYEEYNTDKRRFVEKREHSYDHMRRGEYHGRGVVADDHDDGKYSREYELNRRMSVHTRLHDDRHKPEQNESAKAETRFLRRSPSSPGIERRESRKFGGGMYADKLESVVAEPLQPGVKGSVDKGKMDNKDPGRLVKPIQMHDDDDKQGVSKEEVMKRITNMHFKHPERARKKHLSKEDKKPVEGEDAVVPTPESKHEGSSEFIDQGMHWCGLCNIFCDSLPQYLEHLLQDTHLVKLKNDAKSWFSAPPLEEKDPSALTRPLQGVEFVHSISNFYCELCCRHLNNLESAASHVHAAEHVEAYKNHILENPLYESSFFKAKMNAYAKFMMGQNQEVPSAAPVKTPASSKKKERAFLGERNGTEAVASSSPANSEATKSGAGVSKGLNGSASEKGDSQKQSSTKKLLTEIGTTTPGNKRSAATAEKTPTSTGSRSTVRPSEKTPGSSNGRSRRSVDDAMPSTRRSRSPKRSGSHQKSDSKSTSRETSIRVVARAFGGQPKAEDPKPTVVEDELSVESDSEKQLSDLDYSGQMISDTVDHFVNKLDENDKIIEELKKKVASRIQEKRQAQSLREEEEARNREEEEKEARKKLEAKLDKLARPKPVVGEKKNHARFPLIGKMPFFKSKPTKSMAEKLKDKGVSSKPRDASDTEQSNPSESTSDLVVIQDIEDPKFSKVDGSPSVKKVFSKDVSNGSSEDARKMFEEDPVNLDGEETSGEFPMEPSKGSKQKIAVKSDAEESPDMKSQYKRMLSMTKIKKDKVESQRVPEVIEKLTSFTKESNAGVSPDIFDQVKSKGGKQSTLSEGIIIPGEKSSNSKQKNQKTTKAKKQKSAEEVDASSVNKKLSNEKAKCSDKSDAIGPVLPLAIPLPVSVSSNSSSMPTTTIDLSKLPPGYPKFLGTTSSTPPPQFPSVTSFPPKVLPSESPLSSSFSPSPMPAYGFPPTLLSPFSTVASSVPHSLYPPFLNTTGSPLSGKGLDSLNNSTSSSSVFEVSSVSGSSKAPVSSLPDFTTLFSQPPPMLLRTPPPDMGLHTSSPRVPPPSTGHQGAPLPKREVTPPPPGTEADNTRPLAKNAGEKKSAFDAEEDLLPPGVEPHEIETPGGQKDVKTASAGSQYSSSSSYDPNAHIAVTTSQMAGSAYSSPFSTTAGSKVSDENVDVDATTEMLAHAIPTRAQIDSRLIAAGQLSPSALVEREGKLTSFDLG